MAQNETSPFAPIFFLAYKKESIDYFSSVSSSSIQHYLRKKINKTGRNHLERISEAFRRHLEGMRWHTPLNKNYFLRLYVYTSYADSKRSVSDRWLTNDREVVIKRRTEKTSSKLLG